MNTHKIHVVYLGFLVLYFS